jgi:ArsR family transcriptional regulator
MENRMQASRTFRALADPTRLRIVNLLLHQPSCVCELAETLGLPQPLISRHLAYLRAAGLVLDRRSGTRVNYSVVLDGEHGQALGLFLRQIFQGAEPFEADLRRSRVALIGESS